MHSLKCNKMRARVEKVDVLGWNKSSVSPLSYILRRSSYNFGELILCLIIHMPTLFVEYPPSNGGVLLLARTTVVGS